VSNSVYNWENLQKDYNEGLSERKLCEKHGISSATLHRAKKMGLFKSRTQKEACALRAITYIPSEETRKKHSLNRIAYMENHSASWKFFHRQNISYPEKIFLELLQKSNIKNWIHHYRAGRYQYDFALLDLKIDIEIDGTTHLKPNIIIKDKIRDEWSENQGWRVIRFSAKEIIKNPEISFNKLINFIGRS